VEEWFDFDGAAFKGAQVAVNKREQGAIKVDSCFAPASVVGLDYASPFAQAAFDFAASLFFVEQSFANNGKLH